HRVIAYLIRPEPQAAGVPRSYLTFNRKFSLTVGCGVKRKAVSSGKIYSGNGASKMQDRRILSCESLTGSARILIASPLYCKQNFYQPEGQGPRSCKRRESPMNGPPAKA